MKLTNKNTGVSYNVSDETGNAIMKGPLGKRFTAEKPVTTPPEVEAIVKPGKGKGKGKTDLDNQEPAKENLSKADEVNVADSESNTIE